MSARIMRDARRGGRSGVFCASLTWLLQADTLLDLYLFRTHHSSDRRSPSFAPNWHRCFLPLPKDAREDLEINLDSIQSVLRIARNDAGHPNAAAPNREQVYVLLKLFVPFAKHEMKLRGA